MIPTNGFLIVDKPSGITSSRLVLTIKKILKISKIGHTGTLDRLATGLMILPYNKFTGFTQKLQGKDKKYYVKIQPGLSTDSGDLDGIITEELSTDRLKAVFQEKKNLIIDEIEKLKDLNIQFPPKVSALKWKGKRYSDLYRNSVEFPIMGRPVQIYDLNIHSIEWNEILISIHVSSGTYIRKLVMDLAGTLQIPMVVSMLRRVELSGIPISSSINMNDLETQNFKVWSADEIVPLPKVELEREDLKPIGHGRILPGEYPIGEFYFTHSGELKAWCRGSGATYEYIKVF